MWVFHERCLSSKITRNFTEVVRSMTFPLSANIGSFKGMLSFLTKIMENCVFCFSILFCGYLI